PGTEILPGLEPVDIGRAVLRREGNRVAILAFGSMVAPAADAAKSLNATLADMRFVKPLDGELIEKLARRHDLIVTVEENAIMGGAGSAVNEYLAAHNCSLPVLNLGLPDIFLEHGKATEMLSNVGLASSDITLAIKQKLKACNLHDETV
ncbi:MAG TPA: 1-deoxy-D-xylulose-5-phosphate synthase, partial [Gammaproteobacteria bacterium]|nr:1-deoxy-D-xylulose-5-phosphate synthase [Gammaproteobacteria bacterium]